MSVERGESPIEDALDAFYARLRLPAPEARRALAECEAHLREAAADETARGRTPVEAERVAVARFGDAGAVAASYGYGLRARLGRCDLGSVLRAGPALVGIALVAVGISGVVAAIAYAGFGRDLLGGGPVPTARDCFTGSGSVLHAVSCGPSTSEVMWFGVLPRPLAGVVGVAVLGVAWLIGRRRGLGGGGTLRPRVFGLLVPLFLAGAAAMMFGDGAAVLGGDEIGFYLIGAVGCAVAAPLLGLRDRRRRLRGSALVP